MGGELRKDSVLLCSLLLGMGAMLSLFLYSSLQAGEIDVDNGVVRLVFDESTFVFKRLESNELTYYFDSNYSPIWAITLLDTSVHPVDTSALHRYGATQLSATHSHDIIDSLGGKLLTLRWKDIDISGSGTLSVLVKIFLPAGSPESYWCMQVQSSLNLYSIWSVDFPYISPLANYSGGKLNTFVYPSHAGAIFNNPVDTCHFLLSLKNDIDPTKLGWEVTYPGGMSMQFVYFYDNAAKSGLFISPLDTLGFIKRYNANGQGNFLEYFLRQYPENNHFVHQSYYQPYEVLVKLIQGDWVDAAKLYKNLMLRAPWMKQGRLRDRPDEREVGSMLDIIFVIKTSEMSGDLDTAISILMDYKEFFGASSKYGVWLNGWGWPGFLDDGSVSPKVTQFLAALKDSGMRSVPYTSTRDWDATMWPDPRADSAVARNINGEPYYCTTFEAYIMDPASPTWRNLYSIRANDILQVLGATDIYLDNHPVPMLCYQGEHGHPLGGGSYWIEGYKDIFNEIRTANPDAIMTNESRSEILLPWLDFFPAYYWEEGTLTHPFVPMGAHPIPLSACVYHGYVGFTGSTRHPWHMYGENQFAFQQAYSFINGNKLALYAERQYVSEFTQDKLKDWRYVRELVKYLRVATDWLYYGDWESPPTLSNFGTTEVKFPNYPSIYQTLVISPVLAGAFKSEDGSLGLPFTNFTADTASGKFFIDLNNYEMPPGFYRVYELDTLGNFTKVDSFTGNSYSRDLTLSPMSVKFFIVSSEIGIGEPQNTVILPKLFQNLPNPFTESTTIKYALGGKGWVKLKIYNIVGQIVNTLINKQQKAGTYSITWDGKDDRGRAMPSGIYFIELKIDESFSQTNKLILLR